MRRNIVAQAALTKYHRLLGLNARSLPLIILEAEKSKIKVLVRQISFFSWLADGYHRYVFTWWEEREFFGVSSYKYTNPIGSGPHPHELI